MGAAIGLAIKFGVVMYLLAVGIAFVTGFRWKERKKELARRRGARQT